MRLRFTIAEQEECSVLIRTASIGLIQRVVSLLEVGGGASTTAPAQSLEAVFQRMVDSFLADVESVAGIPVPLLQACLSLLDGLASACGPESAANAAAAARHVLTRYPIEHGAALKGLLQLLLGCTRGTAAAAEAARDVCLDAIRVEPAGGDEGPGGSGDAVDSDGGAPPARLPMLLSTSAAARAVALNAAMAQWRTQLDELPELSSAAGPAATLAALLPPMSDALCAIFVEVAPGNDANGAAESAKAAVDHLLGQPPAVTTRELLGQPAVTTRVLALMSQLLAVVTRPTLAMKAPSVDAAALAAWLPVWCGMAPLLRRFTAWLRRHSSDWSSACRRRVPPLLFASERATMAIVAVLESGGGAAFVRSSSSAAALLRELRQDWMADNNKPSVAPAPEEDPAADDGFGGALLPPALPEGDEEDLGAAARDERRSRRRHRSRNPYIDSELAKGAYGDDSFADLEDFIVCKRPKRR